MVILYQGKGHFSTAEVLTKENDGVFGVGSIIFMNLLQTIKN